MIDCVDGTRVPASGVTVSGNSITITPAATGRTETAARHLVTFT